MRLRTTIKQSGKTATGIEVPSELVAELGAGKRAPVLVTINGYTYRSTLGSMGGKTMIPLSAEHRAGAGVAGGETVDVDIELDTAPRDVEVPEDLGAALDASPAARQTFDGISNSNKKWHVSQATGAKTEETRQRRIAKSIAMLEEGRAR